VVTPGRAHLRTTVERGHVHDLADVPLAGLVPVANLRRRPDPALDARVVPRLTTSGIEAAVNAVLGRNRRPGGSRITVTAGPEGLVTLTGRVAAQVPGVQSLHDELLVGC
jgi:hypothetical protein